MKHTHTPATDGNTILKTWCVALLFLMSISIAFSLSYPKEGFITQDYQQGSIQEFLFNSNYVTTPLIYTKNLQSNNEQLAISYDFDSDGNEEMFVAANSSIRVYRGETLTLNQTITTVYKVSTYYLFSYLGNTYLVVNMPEVTTPVIAIYVNSGGTFTLTMQRPVANAKGSDPYVDATTLQCGNYGSCLYFEHDFAGYMTIYSFNLTDSYIGAATLPYRVRFAGAGMALFYSSFPFSAIYHDDGLNDLYFYSDTQSDNKLTIQSIMYNRTTGLVTQESPLTINDVAYSKATNTVNGVFNENGGYQVAGGYVKESNGKLYSYSANYINGNWAIYDSHSVTPEKPIIKLGNAFSCKVFSNDFNPNYCIIAYSANSTMILGATDYGVGLLQSDEVYATTSNFTNYFTPQNRQRIAHAIVAEHQTPNDVLISDFLTPYGIYTLTQPDYFLGYATLQPVFHYPYNVVSASVQPMSLKNSPYYDLLQLTPTNVIYISDGFITPGAQIDSYTINPCINQPIKLNTTIGITIQPKSYHDYYTVRARSYVYYNSAFQQDSNWSSFDFSGAFFSFNFVANQTGTYTMRMEAQDSQTSSIDVISLSYTVSPNGNEYGACQTTVTGIIANTTTPNTGDVAYNNTATATNNTFTSGVRGTARDVGMPTDIFVIMVILGVDIVVILSGMGNEYLSQHLKTLVFFIFFVDLSALILAGITGLLSTTFIIVLITLVLIVGAIWISSVLLKNSQGG